MSVFTGVITEVRSVEVRLTFDLLCFYGHYRSNISVSNFFFLEEINTIIHQGCIKLIKIGSKAFDIVIKISILNKCCSFGLYNHPRILKKSWFPQKYEAAQLFSTLIIIRHVSWLTNQHIIMISVGSCDTEYWSNNAENSALHHRNKLLHFKIYSSRKLLF